MRSMMLWKDSTDSPVAVEGETRKISFWDSYCCHCLRKSSL